MTRNDDLNNRALEVARVAVEEGLWDNDTGLEFCRLHQTDEDLRFWEEALANLTARRETPPAE